jgi:preprotein translocase subunit SecF
MLLKPLFRLSQKMNLRFVKYFKLCLGLSIFAILGTVVLLFTVGLNFGIDFKGGTLMQIETPGPADVASLRTKLTGLGLGEIQLQSFGQPNEVLIRFPEQAGGPEAQKVAADKVLADLPTGSKELRREQVGSTVSQELITSAIWALVLTNLVIFAYVWFRFEWQFALGAIMSLVHDVMFTIGIFSLFQLDFDLTIVAALLTILGYSINDTVVIYDRIRENLRKYKRMPLGDLLDLSVNETMSRTIMTVGTVLMALIALYIFGGEVIRGFTFAMLFGVLVGTYSSVFIAAPFLILIGVKRDWSGVEKGKAKVAQPGIKPGRPEPKATPSPAATNAETALLDGNGLEVNGAVPQSIGFSASIPLGEVEEPAPPLPPAAPRKPSGQRSSKKGKGQARAGGGRSKRRG